MDPIGYIWFPISEVIHDNDEPISYTISVINGDVVEIHTIYPPPRVFNALAEGVPLGIL